jgi:hypothetical protein
VAGQGHARSAGSWAGRLAGNPVEARFRLGQLVGHARASVETRQELGGSSRGRQSRDAASSYAAAAWINTAAKRTARIAHPRTARTLRPGSRDSAVRISRRAAGTDYACSVARDSGARSRRPRSLDARSMDRRAIGCARLDDSSQRGADRLPAGPSMAI